MTWIKIQLIIFSRLLKTYKKYTFQSKATRDKIAQCCIGYFLSPIKKIIDYNDIFKLQTDRQYRKKIDQVREIQIGAVAHLKVRGGQSRHISKTQQKTNMYKYKVLFKIFVKRSMYKIKITFCRSSNQLHVIYLSV